MEKVKIPTEQCNRCKRVLPIFEVSDQGVITKSNFATIGGPVGFGMDIKRVCIECKTDLDRARPISRGWG